MKPTGNRIFDQVNQIIVDDSCTMNTLCISFPYEYASGVINLNWHDIIFAITHGFLDHRAAIEHAQIELGNDDYPQTVLDLACVSRDESIFPHSISPYIDELAAMVDEKRRGQSEERVMYILLKWVYEHGACIDDPYYDDPLNVAESIFHDFGFPDSIIKFAAWRYNPTNEPDLGSNKKNTARLFDYWNKFLVKQQSLWSHKG